MLREQLKHRNLILASGSPRRQKFFSLLELDFKIDVRPVEEIYPPHLKEAQITNHLAALKASVFTDLTEKDLLITSDTIVWQDGAAIGKPKNEKDAFQMLSKLSGTHHEVYTSVCFTGTNFQKTVSDKTKVWFKTLTEQEIRFYISNFQPFDKAGSYGIQDWLGYIGVEKIEGCFFNVMGLPTRLVYKTLTQLVAE